MLFSFIGFLLTVAYVRRETGNLISSSHLNSLAHFYKVWYYINLVKTSWTYSTSVLEVKSDFFWSKKNMLQITRAQCLMKTPSDKRTMIDFHIYVLLCQKIYISKKTVPHRWQCCLDHQGPTKEQNDCLFIEITKI